MSATSRSIPDVSSVVEAVPPVKSVYIPVTLSGGFHVSSETFWKAQADANNTGVIHWIGNLPDGQEVTGCDPETLRNIGCKSLAWIAPQRCL